MTRELISIALLLTLANVPPGPTETERLAGHIQRLASEAPRHPLNDVDAAKRLAAEAMAAAATVEDVDAELLLVVSFLESSWRTGAVGALGERGLMQVHGQAAKGCDLQTRRGQLDCGAAWLQHSYEVCGRDWRRGLTMYATGACSTRSQRVRWVVGRRLRLAESMRGGK